VKVVPTSLRNEPRCGVAARVKNDNDSLRCAGFIMNVRAVDASGDGFASTQIVGSPAPGETDTFTEPLFGTLETINDCDRVSGLRYEIHPFGIDLPSEPLWIFLSL
jgi:hypothetical protein